MWFIIVAAAAADVSDVKNTDDSPSVQLILIHKLQLCDNDDHTVFHQCYIDDKLFYCFVIFFL